MHEAHCDSIKFYIYFLATWVNIILIFLYQSSSLVVSPFLSVFMAYFQDFMEIESSLQLSCFEPYSEYVLHAKPQFLAHDSIYAKPLYAIAHPSVT